MKTFMVLFSFENIARLEIRFIQCKIKNRTEIFRAKCIIISNEEVQVICFSFVIGTIVF